MPKITYLNNNVNMCLPGTIGIGTQSPHEALTVNGVISLQEQDNYVRNHDGYGTIYSHSDGKLYYRNDVGTSYDLTQSGGTDAGVLQTIDEHYRQHSDAIQTILKDLDGYSSGSGVSATQGSDGYVAFFTSENTIAGDNDLYFNRETNSLTTNSQVSSPHFRLRYNQGANDSVNDILLTCKFDKTLTLVDYNDSSSDTVLDVANIALGIGHSLGNIYYQETYATSISHNYTYQQFGIYPHSIHGRQLIVADRASRDKDFDHETQTNPTIFLHSSEDPDNDNTQYLALYHDHTNARLDVGSGDLNVDADLILDGYMLIDGNSNTSQLVVRADSAQSNSNPLLLFQNSDGNTIGAINVDTQYNAIFGVSSGQSITTGSYNVLSGFRSGFALQGGTDNIILGRDANYNNQSGNKNIVMGAAAGYYLTGSGDQLNVIIGSSAGRGASGLSTYTQTVAIGPNSAYNLTTGGSNVCIGTNSGYNMTTGGSNIAFGSRALYSNVGGNYNVGIGRDAGLYTTSGNNVFIGSFAGENNADGSDNFAMGFRAGRYNQTGDYNIYMGTEAGHGSSGNSHSYNIGMGYRSLYSITTGGNNTAIGYAAGDNLTTGSNNIIIGHNLDASSSTISNELNIGDAIKGNLANGNIEITGDGYVKGEFEVGQVIKSVGNIVLAPESDMVVISVGSSEPGNEQLDPGEIIGWTDEVSNKLMFKVRYSDGTFKSGEINLT
jgi:hypothetical protein